MWQSLDNLTDRFPEEKSGTPPELVAEKNSRARLAVPREVRNSLPQRTSLDGVGSFAISTWYRPHLRIANP